MTRIEKCNRKVLESLAMVVIRKEGGKAGQPSIQRDSLSPAEKGTYNFRYSPGNSTICFILALAWLRWSVDVEAFIEGGQGKGMQRSKPCRCTEARGVLNSQYLKPVSGTS